VVLLDSDDLLRPTCLDRRSEVINRNADLDFAVFQAEIFATSVGDLGAKLYHPQDAGDDLLRFLGLECAWQTSGAIWRRAFLQKVGEFDESLLSMQDLELHVRALCAGARYCCFHEIDHHIRWRDDKTRISVRHREDPVFIEASARTRAALFTTVESAGLLTWSRRRALLGLAFAEAESWTRRGRVLKGGRAWSKACRDQRESALLKAIGLAMLALTALPFASNALPRRLVNKWKGWVRFRQEPDILTRVSTKGR
jgi:hypothetical protein